MRIGCQIGLWGGKQSFEAVIEAVGRLGIAGLEVFDGDVARYYGKAGELESRLTAAGVELTGAYFNMDDSIDADKESAVLARAAEVCDFLPTVGAEFIILNGGAMKEGRTFANEDYRRLASVMNRIGKDARSKGLQAVLHPHLRFMVELPEEVDRLVAEGIDQDLVGLCPHPGHQFHIGADPYVICERHAGWVKYLHIGDAGEDKKGRVVGQGVLDQERLMKPLLEAGYDGWIIIEGGQQNVSPEDYATRSRDYMLQAWPQLRWA